jgi:hypothetical protein
MPNITFRIPEYNAASGIQYTDLGTDILGFAGTGINFRIKINSFPDNTNVLNPKTYRSKYSATNISRYSSGSGSITSQYLSANLPLQKIPNWSSTLNIRFGNATGATNYDVTSAVITASGAIYSIPEYGDINAKPNSVMLYAAEICHTSTSTGVVGSGVSSWSSFTAASTGYVSLVRNPGPSGSTAAVGSTGVPAKVHDWHIALTISPLSLNSIPLVPLSCIVEYL